MAKHTSTALARSMPIFIPRAPAPIAKASNARFSALKTRMAERSKAIAARVRGGAVKEKHRLVSIGVGLGLGLARRYAPETMEKLSFAGGMVTPELTIGIGAYIAAHFVKNEILDHLATAALTVAAYQFGSGAGVEGAEGAGEL